YTYDANGNQLTVTDPSTNVTTTAYYSDGLKSDSTDGAGDHTSYQYDANGNAISVASPSANAGDLNNTARAATLNTYTLDNLLQSTTVPFTASDSQAYTTTYAYDDGGRKTSQHVALMNTSNQSVANDGGTQSFTYYNDDRLQQQVGRDGSTITTEYDAAGNLGSATSGSSSITATYYLDDRTRTVDDGSQTTRFGYDGLGSVTARYQLADNGSNPMATTYVYGDAELATQMAWTGVPNNSTFYAYDQDGRPLSQTEPNGEQLSWVFNADNTLQQQTLTTSGSAVSYTYAYNADYLITQQEYTGPATNGAGATLCYGYDGASRVNNMVTAGAGQACPATLPAPNITWDHDGNRLSYVPVGATQPVQYSYSANNAIQAAGGSTFQYDGAGRTTQDGCLQYTYDGFDRVTKATPAGCSAQTTASYTYDPLDRRATQSGQASTGIHYDGLSASEAVETTSNNGTVAYELSASGAPQGLTSNASAQYLATDGHGNVTTATTQGAGIACAARFDAFGSPLGLPSGSTDANACNTGTTPDDVFFKQSRHDPDTGQYQFGSRVYDPSNAAFLTPDSYRDGTPAANPSVGVDPLTANTYVGLNGDPVNLVDPSGHIPCAGDSPGSCEWPEGRGPVHTTCDQSCQQSPVPSLVLGLVPTLTPPETSAWEDFIKWWADHVRSGAVPPEDAPIPFASWAGVSLFATDVALIGEGLFQYLVPDEATVDEQQGGPSRTIVLGLEDQVGPLMEALRSQGVPATSYLDPGLRWNGTSWKDLSFKDFTTAFTEALSDPNTKFVLNLRGLKGADVLGKEMVSVDTRKEAILAIVKEAASGAASAQSVLDLYKAREGAFAYELALLDQRPEVESNRLQFVNWGLGEGGPSSIGYNPLPYAWKNGNDCSNSPGGC
ncbi:MAG: hypothetical protein JOZ75_07825, partial [Candidatus Dormibacteraeota bacterium]|nr:hypothetical protein [Candidatus Dormibacteraeota bacterium]